MELKVWVDGVVRVVCGLSEETSCQDVVIALAQAIGQTGRYVLIQKLRDTERQLLATERPLESLAKLGQHSNEVQFYLRRTGPSNDGHEHTPSLHKPSETEPPKRNAPRKSLTFSLGPSSSPRARPKQNRRTPSTKHLPESRESPLLHTSHLLSLSREEVFRQVLQQQERLQALEAQLELLERETQAWDQQEELAATEQTLLENEEQWEEELRTEMQREHAMRRQLAELHAKLEECGTSLHDLTTKSTHLEQDIQRERLEAEAPPTRAQPEDSVGVIQTELQSQQKQGEELECELVQTEKALGKAETLLQTKQEQLDELNKELRQCNLQQFIQQTGVLPAHNFSRTDLHQQLDQQELAQLLQDTSIDSDSLQRPTAKQFLGHQRNLRHPLVSSLNPEGATKDMGKMLGEKEEKDPDAEKKEEERQEALRQQEEERKAKYAKMEAERESLRQGIRDKYGIKKKEEKEAEAQAAMEQASEGSLTRPKKAVPAGCGDDEDEEESIVDTVMKFLPGPLLDMFNKK